MNEGFSRTRIQIVRRISWVVFFSASALLAVAFLTPDPPLRFWIDARNAAHVIVFAVLAIAVGWNLRRAFPSRQKDALLYLAIFAITAVVGVAAELMQASTSRTPDPFDVLRNLVGETAGLAIFWLFDRKSSQRGSRKITVALVAMLGLVTLAAGLKDFAQTSLAYLARNSSMPIIFTPVENWAARFITPISARVATRKTPSDFHLHIGAKAYAVITSDGANPGFEFEPRQDWSGYRNLRTAFYNPSGQEMVVVIRLDDRFRAWETGEWAAKRTRLPPGESYVDVSLTNRQVRNANRVLDLNHVRRLQVHIVDSKPGTLLFIGEMRLQ